MAVDLVEHLVRTYKLTPAGESSNTRYFALDDDVLVGVPHQGSRDDGPSARQNVDLQAAYFRARGKKGAVIVFFDRMTGQDKDARRIYAETAPVLVCTAMVGGSLLTRAMVSFFIGLARQATPIKLFAEFDAALAWCRQMNSTHDRALGPAAGAAG